MAVWFVSRLKWKERAKIQAEPRPPFPALGRKRGVANLPPEAESHHPLVIPPSVCTVSKDKVGAWSGLD